MSATLADPYRDYAIDYAQHASCKPEEHTSTLVYHTHQPQLQHPKPPESPFQQGSSRSTAFEHHHANATVLPTANHQPTVHGLSQQVVLTPAQMLSRQLPVHYTPTSFEIPSIQRSKKRHHSETEAEGDDANHGIRPQLSILPSESSAEPTHHSPEMLFSVHGDAGQHHQMQGHDLGSQDSVALPQHHHHHRLPPHASLRDSQRHSMNMESSPFPSGPPSVVGQPGMPDPAPRPRGPKLKFTPEEDALLVELKENKNLTWKQIADFFPGRTSGTLQVRYCTKLKAKDVAWSDEMVQRLQRAMQEYENDRWRIIAGKVGNGFTPAACRERASQLENPP
ncbi:Myb-like transcription factor [Aspergillus bombycis]|uniref:Myb-like transcription factor n=1 Tax=Aspergillus bombycis TaxID=109264 RepID=A0A1F7ZRX2_9EURO|nr:Myb-like transcription factor [Aspergillus bombycis]OGM42210.1 Myb-like transcription factor [Aspergillus bombycis]